MRKIFVFALALAAIFLSSLAAAQDFPARPVRLIVPFPPGGSTDITARLVAQKLQEMWGKPVVVENKAGANAIIGTEAVVNAPADGHTILIATTALPISAGVYSTLRFDPLRDLEPVTLVSLLPGVLVVNPALPAKSLDEFIGLARARPGKLNFASQGPATGTRLAYEMLKQTLGLDVVHIPYKGGAPAVQAVVAGEAESMIVNLIEGLPLIRSGQMRALAVTTRQRVSQLPDVPTLAETVMPGLEVSVWQGVLVPAATPKNIVGKLNRDFRAVLAQPEVMERLAGLGMQMATGTPDEFAVFLRGEVERWGRVAKQANIKEN